MGNKASTTRRHSSCCCASLCASPHVSFISFSSPSTVLLQVFFGRPGLRFPGGVHLNAAFGILSLSILRTWPSHLSRLSFISRTTSLHPVLVYSSLFVILLGQKIRQIFLRLPLWKALILFMSPLTTRQHSEPYMRTDFTQLL